jgi:hypothetical protein
MEEIVWQIKGEERCERSPRHPPSTEKKALPDRTHSSSTDIPLTSNDSYRLAGLPALNKREEASAKITERYLIGQSIQNPFMPNSNFAKDIEDQMKFLYLQKTNT